jgi:6-phosphogluconolactonase (cycloisomerase 2 family)
MTVLVRLAPALAATLVAVATAGIASAATTPGNRVDRATPAVFVQTDDPAGNRVVVYDRAGDGTLAAAGSYATGGLGGVLAGSVVDHLASQGSLAYDSRHNLLYAVNAGSNTVSIFEVRGDRLALRQIVPSGGAFPVSIAVHDNLVYVVNARNGGSVQGYLVFLDRLIPLPRSARPLGLDPAATPEFTNTPGQVGFSPDGSRLIVTTKANGNAIDVFRVGLFGFLSPAAVVNAQPGTVPFAFGFDRSGHLLVTEAGPNALASFTLDRDGTVTQLSAVPTGQAATCWITGAGPFSYVSNAGSATLSGFRADSVGQLALIGATSTDPGTVDAATSPDGRFLYVQTGANGIVDEFRLDPDGSLAPIGAVTVPGAVGGEGIAAS